MTTNTTPIGTIPSEKSFEDVLVLNQAALKAMTIDAMVAESSTGSVNPDAVNAAAIMKFRSSLGANIIAPIPEEDINLGTPQKIPTAITSPTVTDKVPSNTDAGILNCSDELNSYFESAAKAYGLDVKLLKAIACAESNFNPNCTSSSGAMGVMQLMPETAEECGVTNAYDAKQNIMGGAQYIAKMLGRYKGDLTLALAAYNAGPGNVDKYNGVPPFEETQNYVVKVQNYYNS